MKTLTKVIIIIVSICVVIVGAWFWYFSPSNSEPNIWPKEKFSQELWAKSIPAERYKQVRDLLEQGLLNGQATTEVERILGKPSYADSGDTYWTYIVKERVPGDAGFDAVKMIHIDFDSKKQVVKIWVRGD
jgi:hypothetical protein